MTRRGLLLLAHGARDPAWALPFEAVAAVELAFLEFMAPDLAAAGERLAAAGCDRIELVPLFLGAGGHVRKDVPRLLEALRQRHPAIDWVLQPAAGEDARVVAALAAVAVAPTAHG
ncbi:CbiX/SirB N-terminal domain-containing protein [Piscinibacter sakaiensis]|uniref:sirohydrochlorin chelatase n=1 Tax=Piscinibacter sakaiensis TaxID=1547922 RepID=UPI003728A487